MSWMQSLTRLAELEVENLQKRLKEISVRRVALDMALASLDVEAAMESASAEGDAEAGWYLVGFREGLRLRRINLERDLAEAAMEEQGARDALSQAFETQKKYETVTEQARVAVAKETARREGLALDELALRRTGTR